MNKIVLIFLGIMLSCSRKKSMDIENMPFTIVVNDSLSKEKEAVEFIFQNNISDTVKNNKKDTRWIYIYINMFKSRDSPKLITEVMCDTFAAYSTNIREEIKRQVYVKTREMKGDCFIRGRVVDKVFLHAYSDSTKTRMIEKIDYFDVDVFVK